MALSIAASAGAANIRAVNYSANYLIRIVGQIEAGDPDRLAATIRRRGRFPDSFYLESKGGDIDASMEIGRLARKSFVPITAGRICDGACFLAWAGGVNREVLVVELMDIRLPGTSSSERRRVRAYLREMEIPEEVIEIALASDALPMTGAQIEAAVGLDAPSHGRWLAEECGELTPKESQDWKSIQSLKALENSLASMAAGIGDNTNFSVGSEIQRQASRAIGFTEEYRLAVDRKHNRIKTCEKRAIASARPALEQDLL